MTEERFEIRTPHEQLLVCALFERDGHCYAEVKSRSKRDCLDVDSMIHTLMDYKNQIEIQR
jgi:hypothetical protein